jgi:3-keto-5-aminohexanoate cleavage enzyme
MEKLIITVATTGAMTSKENTPYLPTTPEEIAEEVYLSYQAGAAVAHIHVRTDEQSHDGPGEVPETVGLVRERCDIIIA